MPYRVKDKLSTLNQMSFPNAGIVGPYQVNNFRLEGSNFCPGWSLTREVEDHTGTCEHHHLQGTSILEAKKTATFCTPPVANHVFPGQDGPFLKVYMSDKVIVFSAVK
jgi:hypothetical protein